MGYLIETYEILRGHEGADYRKYFELKVGITRGNAWEKKEHIPSQVQEGRISYRVVNPWNELPDNAVEAPSIQTFKSRLDEYLDLS